MPMRARASGFAIALCMLATRAHATERALERADSLYALGERTAARAAYARAFADEPGQSRALFRMAELTPDHAQAVRLFERYNAMEPDDAWGFMATGDRLARWGRTRDALTRYEQAARLAPGERDVVAGRARILARAGRDDGAEQVLEPWLAAHPDDAELARARGRVALRSGRPRRAEAAFAQALVHAAPEMRTPLERERTQAHAQAGPSVEPLFTISHDSDGDEVRGAGLSVALLVADGARLGLRAAHHDISGAGTRAKCDEGGLDLEWRPRASTRVTASAGISRNTPAGAATIHSDATGELRVRWTGAHHTPAFELRAQRAPVIATPELIASQVVRNEVRVSAEVPLARLRLRVGGRGAQYASSFDRNLRRGAEARLALRVTPAFTPWVRAERSGFRDATAAGYFAPRLADGATAGASFVLGEGDPLTLELDLGAGWQRQAAQGGDAGPWRRAAEAYAWSSLRLGPARELRLELEAGDSPGLTTAAAPTANWSYWSASLALGWALR